MLLRLMAFRGAREPEIFSRSGRMPENFEILERVGIWERIGKELE